MSPSRPPVFEVDGSFFSDVDGEVVETAPDDHPGFVDVATLHGNPQFDDEPDLEGNGYLWSSIGRIGDHYYELENDSRRWADLGQFDAPADAANGAAGADFRVEFASP